MLKRAAAAADRRAKTAGIGTTGSRNEEKD